jgi:hypothetical protein
MFDYGLEHEPNPFLAMPRMRVGELSYIPASLEMLNELIPKIKAVEAGAAESTDPIDRRFVDVQEQIAHLAATQYTPDSNVAPASQAETGDLKPEKFVPVPVTPAAVATEETARKIEEPQVFSSQEEMEADAYRRLANLN